MTESGQCTVMKGNIQGVFFTGVPPLDWPPPNLLGLAPPKLSKCWNHIHFARHLDVFRSKGGQSGTLTFFWNQLLTGQHLANSGEAQLIKTPCISGPIPNKRRRQGAQTESPFKELQRDLLSVSCSFPKLLWNGPIDSPNHQTHNFVCGYILTACECKLDGHWSALLINSGVQ